MSILGATVVSTASLGSHQRIDVRSATEITCSNRRTLIEVAFPYLEAGQTVSKESDYDAYFDELDALEKARADAGKAPDPAGSDGNAGSA